MGNARPVFFQAPEREIKAWYWSWTFKGQLFVKCYFRFAVFFLLHYFQIHFFFNLAARPGGVFLRFECKFMFDSGQCGFELPGQDECKRLRTFCCYYNCSNCTVFFRCVSICWPTCVACFFRRICGNVASVQLSVVPNLTLCQCIHTAVAATSQSCAKVWKKCRFRVVLFSCTVILRVWCHRFCSMICNWKSIMFAMSQILRITLKRICCFFDVASHGWVLISQWQLPQNS